MKLRNTLFCFFALCFAWSSQAQDRHFTLYNFSPITLNPALTGSFLGTARIGGIYRAQSFSPTYINAPLESAGGFVYNTPNFYADAPLLTIRKRDWVSAGINFLNDKSGSLDLGEISYKLSGAYHLSLDKKSNSIFTLGLSWGQVTRSYLPDNAKPQNIDDPTISQPLNGENAETRYTDYGAGIMLRSKMNDGMNIEIGLVANHLTTPGDGRRRNNNNNNNTNTGGQNVQNSYNFQDTSNVRVALPMLWTTHGKFDIKLDDQFSISPSFLIQATRATPPEAVIQLPVGMMFNKETNQKLSFGLGYRLGDALEFLVGYDHKDIKVGASFDLTTSQLSTFNNNAGAFEIAASYIIKVYKQPKVEPAILCPRF